MKREAEEDWVADEHRGHWLRRLQGFVTELLRVAFASFRKLYDLLRDGVPVALTMPSPC